ncbi:hypothetical protein CDD81_6778 [Ophiocordyceps australis]|uniref:Uncharacterized protein n=1 Tax=Ophiocordyceps australis TaxID=1399860 RepID=A0A2C5X9A5_9HYPO|nr:hypothetical protein CDD81_6778 [Ophiocordyceps australis]
MLASRPRPVIPVQGPDCASPCPSHVVEPNGLHEYPESSPPAETALTWPRLVSLGISSPTTPIRKKPEPLRHINNSPGLQSSDDDDDQYNNNNDDDDDRSFQSPGCLRSPGLRLTGDRDASIAPYTHGHHNRAASWNRLRSSNVASRAAAADSWFSRTRISPAASAAPASLIGRRKSTPSSPRFSFLASSMSALKGLASPTAPTPQGDGLANLDVEAVLVPAGAPAEGEEGYKSLHSNALGLLRRFQAAHRQQSSTLHQLQSERETFDDEKLELETRTQHLKMQLEEMARKAAETESIMQALMEELTREKKMRVDEQQHLHHSSALRSNRSTMSEDLAVDEAQRRRRSAATSKSDMGSDTDEDSIEGASVFSRSRSPTFTATTSDVGTLDSMPPPPLMPSTLAPTKPAIVMSSPPLPSPVRHAQPQMSAFQKLFKGMSSGDGQRHDTGVKSCRNCQGQDASVAWDTVSLLRDENRGLKQRVGDLEAVVDEALDVVNGIGM